MTDTRKTVAAVVTEYRPWSHAENIVNKLLEGHQQHWVHVPPRLNVVSLYTDQVPDNDVSRKVAARHNLPIYPTIRETLTAGSDRLAVDGVVLIGEHGDYPLNERGQKLYPRRRFFEETVAVFRESGRVVPVFSDKHLSWNWNDAKWMYDTAQELGIPFMAGSSMPLAPRCPPVQVPMDSHIEEIVVAAHGGIETYGFHALEVAQCLTERRRGYETGCASVQFVTGDALWNALDSGNHWSPALQRAAFETAAHAGGSPQEWYEEEQRRRETEALAPLEWAAFLVRYRDGLHLAVLMLPGYIPRRAAAIQIAGRETPMAMWFVQERLRSNIHHFDAQAELIERMVDSGRALFPLERTLLTTGMTEAVMISRHEGGRRVETPHLNITYQPAEAGLEMSAFQY